MPKFHIDAHSGNDSNSGLSPALAWKSLSRARKQALKPGDSLLLKRGCVWKGGLKISGQGRKGNPITLETYGSGPRPRLVSGGNFIITNDGPVSWWLIKGFELKGASNYDPHRKGPGHNHGIIFSQSKHSEGMVIEDCLIHEVDGAGIVFSAETGGITVFDSWTVRDCEVFNAGTGITTHGPWPPGKNADRCHSRFLITGCRVHDIATDGIVLSHCRDGVIEYCTACRTGIGITKRSPVGIWYFMARRCVIQFCESYHNYSAGCIADGGGFDLDGGCIDCVMQYNYSHDNDGAGFLICSYEPREAPCTGCITRFNISINDGRANDYPSILFWQAINCKTYNNTCISRVSSPLKFISETHGHVIANNVFIIDSERDIPVVKSLFALDSNTFRNNIYFKTGGKTRFEVRDQKKMNMSDFINLVRSKGELYANPKLSSLTIQGIIPKKGSPCTGKGIRLPGMGNRDYFGVPIDKSARPPVGCALPMKR